MSHGKTDSAEHADASAAQGQRTQQHYKMLYQGRSFSGHERNCCFLNTLSGDSLDDRFATISAVSGMDIDDDGRGLAYVDWDQDGDLDVWVSNRTAPRLRFFRNESDSNSRGIQFLLQGNGADTNRQAVGARVTLRYRDAQGNPQQVGKTLRAGEGFVSQSTLWLHFGLGSDAEIESVSVRWPNAQGTIESFSGLDTGGRWILVQGQSQAQRQPERTDEIALAPSVLVAPADPMVHRIPLIYPMQAPALGMFDFDGKPHKIQLRKTEVTLINLWSATCKPCLKELKEFAARADEIKSAGIRVIPISVDELQSGSVDGRNAAREMAEQLNLPFEVGLAPPAVVQDFSMLHDMIIALDRALPMPSSFLINRQGDLAVIYKGPVDVDTLLEDAQPREYTAIERYERAAAFPGRVLDPQGIETKINRHTGMVHYRRAKQLFRSRMWDEAEAEFEMVRTQWPDNGTVVNDLGVLMMMKGNFVAAEKRLSEAKRLKPEDPEIGYNLARTLQKLGKDTEAIALMRDATSQFPDHANSHFLLGVLLTQKSDFKPAVEMLKRTVEIDPKHDQAFFALANIAMGRGETEEAIGYLIQARDLSPNQPVVLQTLAKAYTRVNDWGEAEKALRILVDLQPNQPEGHFQLGMVLMAQRKFSDAQKCFARTLQINKNHSGALEAQRRVLANLSH